MERHIAKIKDVFFVTHDVKSIIAERPKNYTFEPGQATEVAINKKGWVGQKRPFTFTSLPEDEFLQLIIKTYPERKGVTEQILQLHDDDELILHDVFGTITYRGKGTFIAGGAGITPFVAIFRHLHSKNQLAGNRLIFANKTSGDIILEKELRGLFNDHFVSILSEENKKGHDHGLITQDYLKEKILHPDQYIYVCGPPPMMDAVLDMLAKLGISEKKIIKEGL